MSSADQRGARDKSIAETLGRLAPRTATPPRRRATTSSAAPPSLMPLLNGRSSPPKQRRTPLQHNRWASRRNTGVMRKTTSAPASSSRSGPTRSVVNWWRRSRSVVWSTADCVDALGERLVMSSIASAACIRTRCGNLIKHAARSLLPRIELKNSSNYDETTRINHQREKREALQDANNNHSDQLLELNKKDNEQRQANRKLKETSKASMAFSRHAARQGPGEQGRYEERHAGPEGRTSCPAGGRARGAATLQEGVMRVPVLEKTIQSMHRAQEALEAKLKDGEAIVAMYQEKEAA